MQIEPLLQIEPESVGWVEQRETHHLAGSDAMGIAPLNPSYELLHIGN
jgi:hypothetical protein